MKIASMLRLRQRGHVDLADRVTDIPVEKIGATLTPNLRALRLAMTVSDVLLSMGITASSVVSKVLDITETFCDQPVHINITADIITISQMRGIEREPLTLVRPATVRDINMMTLQSVQHLVYEIRTGKHTLASAEKALDQILSEPITYPKWVPPLASSLIAPAVALMFTTNWHVILITFLIAVVLDLLLDALARKAVVPFFRQAAAGALVTLAAAAMAWLAREHVRFFNGIDTTLIVVGGIFMLLSGLAIVGAVQDALEEYYVTASSRILRVLMLTGGIVMGILVGLYAARKLGIGIAVSPNPLQLALLRYQVIGGAAAAAAFALATQTRLRAILWAGLVGGCSLGVMYIFRDDFSMSVVPATGIAAVFVGLVASLFSRLWRTPSYGITAAGIIPLVPGLSLYTGLMQLVSYPPGDPLFFRGVGTMFTVAGIALAIAAGASFGTMLGRPLYRHVSRARNLEPFVNYMRLQVRADSKKASKFMHFIPRRPAE